MPNRRFLPLLCMLTCLPSVAAAQDKATQIVTSPKKALSCSKRNPPAFPREAIRAGIKSGRVSAVVTIDENGNVADLRIVSSDPPNVFDRVTREALLNWKCKAEGSKYEAPVDINFTLRSQ